MKVAQTLNHEHATSVPVTVNPDGSFAAEVKLAQTSITARHKNCETAYIGVPQASLGVEQNIVMTAKAIAKQYSLLVNYDDRPLYAESNTLQYTLYNGSSEITDFRVIGNTLHLGSSINLPPATPLTITVIPNKNYVFAEPVSTLFSTAFQSDPSADTISLDLIKWGNARGTMDSASTVHNAFILLFDEQTGEQVFGTTLGYWYNGNFLSTPPLKDGNYTLLGVIAHRITEKIAGESDLANLHLDEGEHYYKNSFTITAGQTTDLGTISIPYADIESISGAFGKGSSILWEPAVTTVNMGDETLVRLNYQADKAYENTGGTFTFEVKVPTTVQMKRSGRADGLSSYTNYISLYNREGKKANCEIYTYGLNAGGGTDPGAYFTVATTEAAGTLYFYVIKNTGGSSTLSASAHHYIQGLGNSSFPIGGVTLTVEAEDLSLTGRSDCLVKTNNNFWIYAMPGSQIQLYVDGKARGGPCYC